MVSPTFKAPIDYDKKMDSYYFFRRGEQLQKTLETLDKDIKILDFGCGTGNFILFLKELGFKKVQGFDLTPSLLETASEKGIKDLVLADGDTLPYKNKFDLIIMLDVIEHLPHPAKTLCEVHDLLEKNGTIFITYPNPNLVPLLNFLGRIGAKVRTVENKVKLNTLINDISDYYLVTKQKTIVLGSKLPGFLLNILEGIESILPQRILKKIGFAHILVLKKIEKIPQVTS